MDGPGKVETVSKHGIALGTTSLALFFWLFVCFEVKGPQWIMVPQDLGYTYVLNGLSVVLDRTLGVLIHPGITVSYAYAALIYLYYEIAGVGTLQTHVVENAETYAVLVSTVTTFGIAIGSYFLGRSVYQLTKKILYAVITVFVLFLIPTKYLPLVAFGSPESFILIIFPFITGIACLRSCDHISARTFICSSAILCAVAVGVKFIAAPILILPFLVSRGFKEKLQFSVAVFLALLCVFAPIYLDDIHIDIFRGYMDGLFSSANLERVQTEQNLFVFQVLEQTFTQISGVPVFCFLLIIQILVFPFVKPGNFRIDYTLHKTARFNAYLLATICITVAFLAVRPKVGYFLTFTSLQGTAIAISLYLLHMRVSLMNLNQRFTKLISISVVIVLGSVVLIGLGVATKGLSILNGQRIQSMWANDIIDQEKNSHALVTAVTSSHISTAFEHANQTSRFFYAHEINKVMKPNWFNYSFDGSNVWDRNRQRISFIELSQMYNKVLFWGTRGQFAWNDDGSSSNSGVLAPRAQFKILVGRAKTFRKVQDRDWPEILAELQGIEVFSAKNSGGGELEFTCFDAKACYNLVPQKGSHKLTSIALWFKNDEKVPHESEEQRTASIINAWKLEGLNTRGFWEPLDLVWDNTLLAKGARWVFRVEPHKPYQSFRLLANQAKDHLTEVRLYAPPKKQFDARILPRSLYLYENKGAEQLISQNFWESTGPFPVLLSRELDLGDPITSYTLGCANHGENGLDSTNRMPISWKLFGETKNAISVLLDSQENVAPWKANETRKFDVKNIAKIQKLTLMVKQPNLSPFARISTFSVTREPSMKRAFVPKLSHDLISGNFWESTKAFPVSLTNEIDVSWKVQSYELGAAFDGPNEVDSTSRMPISWKIYGKSEHGPWVLLDSKEDVAPWEPNETRIYSLSDVPEDLSEIRLVSEKTVDGRVVRISVYKLHSQVNPLALSNDQIPLEPPIKRGDFLSKFLEQSNLKFPAGVEMHLAKPAVVTSYVLRADRHGQEAIDRMPSKWKFQGFDSLRWEWVDLHSVEATPEWKPSEQRRYHISKPSSYPAYRLHISELVNKQKLLRLGHISLYSSTKIK